MALTQEWKTRIDKWRDELKNQLFTPLVSAPVEAFFTFANLPYEKAVASPFKPVIPKTPWGRKWEYGWFKTQFTVPKAAAGKSLSLKFDMGGEALIFVNGKARSTFSSLQDYCIFTEKAKLGEKFLIVAEVYGGHGPTVCHTGPVGLDRKSVPEPPEFSRAVGECAISVFDEDAFQLWIDVRTLRELRDNLDPDSLRVSEIDVGLRDFTLIADPELPAAEKAASFRKARERLKPLLQCVNGSTTPAMFAFGHAHLDVAWLWPLAETERKAARTLSTQLSLAERYPGYKFLHSQPHLFRFVKDHYPELYARVKDAVRKGSVVAEGGMWVEADTNVTGGESLIRQFIHGKRFFKEEFGVESVLMWLPDVFGYSGNMPQIMKGCGIKYFSTAKIFWNYNGGEIFPHNTFFWEGIDGSRVLVHLHNNYNSQISPSHVVQRWKERVQKDGISTRLLPFGWGDGGGGPTREHLEFIAREGNLEGMPKVKMASPVDYFTDLEKRGFPDLNYVGELYFQAHRGTYTSQAKTKKGNRKSEIALREAEFLGVAARALRGFSFSAKDLDVAWKAVLLNQFHDILPGSSIGRVYKEAEAAYAKVLQTASGFSRRAAAKLAEKDASCLTVTNSLSWPRKALVELPGGFRGAKLPSGEKLSVQKDKGRVLAEVTVPSCGWVTVEKSAAMKTANNLKVSSRSLENNLVKAAFNDKGELESLYDKESKREILAGPCNSFRMYKDVPGLWDAWDIDSSYVLCPVDLPAKASIEVISKGPLAATLKISRKLNRSLMMQEVSLARNSRRLDFRTTVDWKERHKMLKVNFPVAVHSSDALHEIQMGHVRRPTHQSRQYDQDRFEVCQHKWTALCEENKGCAVLNDCKYGVNVDGRSINVTLLKSALAPDMTADLGRQEFTYALYSWNGPFSTSRLFEESYELNLPALSFPGNAGSASLFSVDEQAVKIETVKPAEDNLRDIVVRLYESTGASVKCELATTLPVKAVEETDMLERRKSDVRMAGSVMKMEFGPFEIKTLRMKM
jgi:alpha-mannosidase